MAQRFRILLILLALCCITSAGPLSRSPCELLPVGTGHPVQAVLKSFTVMSGCASRGTVSLPQEVHVINLRGHAAEGPNSAPAKVELHLKPIQSMRQHQKPLVFVLNSPQPVIWNVKAENLALHVRHIFHVSQGSEVHFKQANFSLNTEILEKTLPQGNEQLLNWAQKKYRAVTSFSELRMTQAINIKVGEDPVFSDTCTIDTKFLSLNYLGSYEEPQTSKGCILSVPDKDKEVHIIELQAPNSSSAFQVDVIVDIRPLKDDGLVLRDIVLVLKCAKSVHWVVKAHNVKGILNVVASDTVSVSSQMKEETSPRQLLPSGSQALIKWALDKGYSPVTSYTSTPMANHFNIRVREQDVVDLVDSRLPPELSILRHSSPLPEKGPAQRRSSLPFSFPAHLPINMPNLNWEDTESVEERSLLDVGHSVQCVDNRMVISIDKKSLEVNGFANATLTLKDPKCKAKVNATHYTLETSLTGCNTTVFPMYDSPMAIHFNSVKVNPSETQDYKDLDSADEVLLKHREDVGRSHMETLIEFNCTYRKSKDVSKSMPGFERNPVPPRPPVNDISLEMELYDTQYFNSPSRQAFFTVFDQKQVFVQITSTASDPDVGLTITSCFISPSSNPALHSDYMLIETVCPKDNSFKWTQNLQMDIHFFPQKMEKTFSFTFNSKFNISFIFLHCEMSLCSKGSRRNLELPQCLDPSNHCASVTVDKILPLMMNKKVLTKQMLVTDENGGPKDHPNRNSEPGPSNEAELFLLDTTTVVGIAFAAFVIGALLTGALWFIYAHTERYFISALWISRAMVL
ncbi:transforming growth factor beta receptor type 3 isoform X2 [Girardinichthys multiradiatus]|uniref:transforming growth factor beta receptor type 3 isoform X2 n=1 Tax=Girardinichthys multiradiatus TaxID=208333 RepID=UPI001FAC826E|nr:transforming growth factor beta receptor type 3 isoform X2 [Girardinichthys multiradiatus]